MSNINNNLARLNDILFDQLDRLDQADNKTIDQEIERSKAITQTANSIIANQHQALENAKYIDQAYGRSIKIGDSTAKLLDVKRVENATEN